MRKIIFLYVLLTLTPFLYCQPVGTFVMLRTAKVAASPSMATKIQRQLARVTPKISAPQVHLLAINSRPITAHQALKTSQKLLIESTLKTSLLKAPSIEPLEQNLSRFLFTITSVRQPNKVIGTGFVFATQQGGSTQLWGATSADVAKQAGDQMMITFHTPDNQKFSFPATTLLESHSGNIALLQIPQTASQIALPIALDTSAPQFEQNLIAYGFSKEGELYKTGHALFFYGSERMFAQAPTATPPLTGGSFLINDCGQAVGIYIASHKSTDPKAEQLLKSLSGSQLTTAKPTTFSEIVPARHLAYLLREYRSPEGAARVMLFDGIVVGKLEVDEKIVSIYTSYEDKPIKKWDIPSVWSLSDLSKLIDASGAQKVRIIIENQIGKKYAYNVDLLSRTADKVDLP